MNTFGGFFYGSFLALGPPSRAYVRLERRIRSTRGRRTVRVAKQAIAVLVLLTVGR